MKFAEFHAGQVIEGGFLSTVQITFRQIRKTGSRRNIYNVFGIQVFPFLKPFV